MGATEKLRKVMALPEVVQNVELAEKLKNIYEDYNELVDKNYKLTQKLENMEKISKDNGYNFFHYFYIRLKNDWIIHPFFIFCKCTNVSYRKFYFFV